MKRCFCLFFAVFLLLSMPVFAQEGEPVLEEGIQYSVSQGEVTITGYTGTATALKLPSVIEGYPVTAIGKGAFMAQEQLREILLPEGLRSIANNSFSHCTGLTSITLPEGLSLIGDNAFSFCYRLAEVIDKTSLGLIAGSDAHGKVAFYARSVHDGQTKLVKKDGFVFCPDQEGYVLISYEGSQTTPVVPSLDAPCVAVGAHAFRGSRLSTVVLPDTIRTLGERSFFNCMGLVSITLPKALSFVGAEAFYNCLYLAEVINPSALPLTAGRESHGKTAYYALEVHNGPSKILRRDDFVFYRSTDGYVLITYEGTRSDPAVPALDAPCVALGKDAFRDNRGLKSIVLPEGIRLIGERAFYYCEGLESLTLPASLESVGAWSFSHCPSLETLSFGGTQELWERVTIAHDNESLLGVSPVFLSQGGGKVPNASSSAVISSVFDSADEGKNVWVWIVAAAFALGFVCYGGLIGAKRRKQ